MITQRIVIILPSSGPGARGIAMRVALGMPRKTHGARDTLVDMAVG